MRDGVRIVLGGRADPSGRAVAGPRAAPAPAATAPAAPAERGALGGR